MRLFTKQRTTVVGLSVAFTVAMGLAGFTAPAVPTLPDAALQHRHDASLPDKAGGGGAEDANAHGKAVSELARSLEGGCEKGQAISALASSKSLGHRQDVKPKHDPCTSSETRGNSEAAHAAEHGRSGEEHGPPADRGGGKP
jgi:hypothetical protein